MMYLIIKEITFKNLDSVFDVINFTNDIDKANDMLQGYNLINKEDNVIYTLVKYDKKDKVNAVTIEEIEKHIVEKGWRDGLIKPILPEKLTNKRYLQ